MRFAQVALYPTTSALQLQFRDNVHDDFLYSWNCCATKDKNYNSQNKDDFKEIIKKPADLCGIFPLREFRPIVWLYSSIVYYHFRCEATIFPETDDAHHPFLCADKDGFLEFAVKSFSFPI